MTSPSRLDPVLVPGNYYVILQITPTGDIPPVVCANSINGPLFIKNGVIATGPETVTACNFQVEYQQDFYASSEIPVLPSLDPDHDKAGA